MIEAGLTERWRRNYWPKKNKCTDISRGQQIRKLNLLDLQSAFLVLAVGLALATLAFIGEHVHNILSNKYKTGS